MLWGRELQMTLRKKQEAGMAGGEWVRGLVGGDVREDCGPL